MKLRSTIIIVLGLVTSALLVAGSSAARDVGKIAFMSTWDGEADIYLMNAGGTNQVNLTHDKAIGERHDIEPAWSPDGRVVAFERHYAKVGGSNLMLVDANGKNLRKVTLSTNGVLNSHPSWFPNGTSIVFSSNRDGNFDLYVTKANGAAVQQLTFTRGVDNIQPKVSADGNYVVFARTGISPGGSGATIYLLKVSTGTTFALTRPAPGRMDFEPSWSPSGKIAFVSNRAGSNDIYVMNIYGGAVTRMTSKPSNENHPTWSQDGATLAFVSDRTGATEIYTLTVSDLVLTQITADRAVKSNPTWQRSAIRPGG